MAFDKPEITAKADSGEEIFEQKVASNPFISIEKISEKRGLKILIYGLSGKGKTHFCLTAPEPLYVIDTERGVSPLKKIFVNKNINICEINFRGSEKNVMESDEVDAFVNLANAANFLTQDSTNKKTIVVDSATDLWTYAQSYAKVKIFKLSPEERVKMRFDWGKINNLHKRIINRLIGCDSHVIFTARSQEEYDSTGNPLGIYKPQCQKNLEYDVDIIIEIKSKSMKTATNTEKVRAFKIQKCRQKGELEGQIFENLTFDKLQEMINK